MMFKIKFAIALVGVLSLSVIYACGGDTAEPLPPLPPSTARPAPTPFPPPTVARAAPSAPSPAVVPSPISARTSMRVSTPTPVSAASTPTHTPIPIPTPEPTSTSASDASDLASKCISDGSLTDPELIIACSEEAMRQLQSVVVRMRIDLGAFFMSTGAPGTAEPDPVMEMEIARVLPDDMNAVIKNPDGQKFE